MDVLDEAKEIMKKAGCKKAFAVYGLELNDIAEVKNCDENGESLELEKDISELVPTIEQKLVFNPEKWSIIAFFSTKLLPAHPGRPTLGTAYAVQSGTNMPRKRYHPARAGSAPRCASQSPAW